MVIDAPVAPEDLNALFAAFLNDLEHGVDSCDTSRVVVVHGVDEEVLHVNHDQDRLGGVDGAPTVVANSIVGV